MESASKWKETKTNLLIELFRNQLYVTVIQAKVILCVFK